MNYRDKISSSNKSVYILILSAGVIMALAIAYSLFMGIRVNFTYTTLLDASLNIKTNVLHARTNFLRYSENENPQALNDAWQSLSLAEFNAHVILEEKDKMNIVSLPLNDLALKENVQQFQVVLLEFRGLSFDLGKKSTPEAKNEFKTKLELIFSTIDNNTALIETDVRALLASQIRIFRFTQFGLIGISVLLSFISVLVFYRYEKQRDAYIKEIKAASLSFEKGLHRTTKTEEALQESQRKLSTLVQNLPGMVYRCKLGQVWVLDYVSDKCLHVTGFKSEDLINNRTLSYYDLIYPEDLKKNYEIIKTALEERKSFQLIYRIKTAAGFEKWVWEQGAGIYSEKDDDTIALEGFITDITEQKNIEEQINLQSTALEAAANGIVITDKDGNALWANTAFTKLTGYSLKEVTGKNLNVLKSGQHDESYYSYMWNKIKTGEIWRGEIINKRKDGSLYTEEMTITPTKNPSGEIIFYVAVKQDITERKLAEQALQESELRFRGLFENATVGIYQTTPEGKTIMANPTLLKITGYNSLDEFFKLDVKNIYADNSQRNIFKTEIERTGLILGFEAQWKKKDGTLIFIRESARAVRDENDKILYYEGTVEDITEKKKTEEALIEAKNRAELSDRLKSEFLAQMSHEIRTPLNVILSFTSMMKDELQAKVDEEMANGFDVIDTEGKRIMRTVELILNMSELQTGSYSYRAKRIDLYKDVLQKTFNNFQSLAKQKKISLTINDFEGDPVIEADEYSINQIFSHMVDNAIKYTSKGKVEISINRDSRDHLFVDIADTGIGISDEYMPMLFTPFTREEKGYTRNFEGNGLGLSLVKKYCELNGADIKVTSKKGKGTTFRVIFPTKN
ncbi:MAG: PAS domain-containing sensor histidine kinase [Bacteroidota bacterium]